MQPKYKQKTSHTDQRITLRQWLCARTPKDTGSRRILQYLWARIGVLNFI